MPHTDTCKLLRECNAGIKMGVSSIDEVLPSVQDSTLRKALQECRNAHATLGDETHALLLQYGESDKEPNPVAKSMSWIKTNFKLSREESDKTVSDLMTDGCNMGVKSLHRYLNQYKGADPKVQQLAKRLIRLETDLTKTMQPYL